MRLLVVDDEVEFAAVLGKLLRRRGWESEAVHDGAAALTRIAERPADVILLDVKMPGKDGVELVREIKRLSPKTQVILMTGHLSFSDEERGRADGAYAYLLKPYPIPDLVAIIEAAVRSRT